MVRVALLLAIVAAFVVLVLSNFSPIALNFLGFTTQSLPLGLWVVLAVILGGLTTLLMAGLVGVGRSTSASARSKRTPPRSTNRTTTTGFRTPWSGGRSGETRQPASSTGDYTGSYTRSPGSTAPRTGDDWETTQQSRDDWNDWGAPADLTDRQTVPNSNTQVRDTEDEAWANWDGYEDLELGKRTPSDEFDEFEDEVVDRHRASQNAYPDAGPRRTDFEAKQEPETQRQSGSVYSVSYRRADGSTSPLPPPPPPPPRPNPNSVSKPSEVYDAEYRVITPPYRPDLEEVPPPTNDVSLADSRDNDDWGDDDWGLDLEDDDLTDRPNS
ncbi:hypothetical protein [Thermocoleostomius sinensis]|uniref:LapA family protein n=1 Tax=Thermocoleostomius sinensis A174 TaxID=2016057 RepID=A0A9E9CC94_9CYAN|nr:hypothetical protein [Thermocoleostomius sinensis]WAL62330.1 hypothetical protein OXH18_10175 [Thermocoleostomius sinensis A174]